MGVTRTKSRSALASGKDIIDQGLASYSVSGRPRWRSVNRVLLLSRREPKEGWVVQDKKIWRSKWRWCIVDQLTRWEGQKGSNQLT